MSCAENIKNCWRQDRFDENFERAAANQAGVILRVLVQVEGEGARLFLVHHFASRAPDVGLDAATTDRAAHRAVLSDQHLGSLERGNRSAHVDDGGDGAAPALAAQFHDLLVDVHLFLII